MEGKDFNSSLKPLSTFFQFVGIPLNWFAKKKKKKPTVKILTFIILVAIVTANLFFNGPRGIEIGRFKFMEKIYTEEVRYKDSPFLYLKFNPFGIVKLVGIIADMAFFCYVPFIHVAFVAMILLNPNWKKLIGLLDKIQREMKLDEEFHRKCRQICFVALFQLAIVSQ